MTKNKENKNFSKTVVLLDAHAILHRSYHAMGDFRTRDGRPTGALYGFISMVLRVYKELKPEYIAACFDLPKPTFRHHAYEAYKGTRTKSDDALITQLKEAVQMCEDLNIPVYSKEGYEADDILGTISTQLKKEKDIRTIIASGDMDTLQLVDDDKVFVYTLKRGNDAALFNADEVIKKYGFAPKNIPDYKGLAGDSSDNIIGIKGIGDKTATDLVKNFGTLENLFKELKKDREKFLKVGIKERMVGLLEEGEEEALFSKTLATIICDAPVKYVFPVHKWKEGINISKYEEMCDKYEFRSLKNKFQLDITDEFTMSPVEEKIDSNKLEELMIMTNLIHSEVTNPKADDIKNVAGTKTLVDTEEKLLEQLKEKKLLELYESVEKPLMPIIREMEKNGITLDVEKLNKLSKKLHEKVTVLEKEIYKLADEEFNISSPKQLGNILYEKLNLGLNATGDSVASPDNPKGGLRIKIKKTAGGAKSTNITELEKIKDENPVVEKIIEYRELTKLLSTYIDTLPTFVKEDGKIHAHFVQTGTGTGRFSCENPNLQTLPTKGEFGKEVKEAFVVSKGKLLVSLDYAQIDLRSAAILSQDKNLIEIFEKGIDVHTGTAMKVFGVSEDEVDKEMRRKAKAINFGILYGMGVTSLKEAMKVERKEAQEFYDQYKNTFTRLMEYLEEVKAYAFKNGFTVTLLGRRREVPLLKSPLPFLRAQGERIAINAPIQGTSADIIKLAMIDTFDYVKENKLEDKVKLVLQIHDEIIFEVDEDIAEKVGNKLKKVLEEVLSKRKISELPLVASTSVGKNLEVI